HVLPSVVHRLLDGTSHGCKRPMGNGWDISTTKQIGPGSATILDHIHIHHPSRWNAQLPQWPDDGMHGLLVLSIDKQTVWNSPLRLGSEKAFIYLLIERTISVRFCHYDEFIEQATKNTSRPQQWISHQQQYFGAWEES